MSMASNTKDSPPGQSAMVDVAHVAEMLGVNRATVLRWVKDKELPRPLRIGRIIRWPRGVIEDFIAGKSAQPG